MTVLEYIAPRSGWENDGACRTAGVKAERFFTTGNPDPARQVCNGCPVQTECLRFALLVLDFENILGGTTGPERRHLLERLGLPTDKERNYVSSSQREVA